MTLEEMVKELNSFELRYYQGMYEVRQPNVTAQGLSVEAAILGAVMIRRQVGSAADSKQANGAPAVNHLFSIEGGEIPQAGQDY